MTPQSPTDAFVQGSMYIIGTGGSIFTWVSDEKIFAGCIALLTTTLLITNIVLNLKRIKQLDRDRDSHDKPDLLPKKPKT